MGPETLTVVGDALRRPVGRIHWAGTETAREWIGYMDGGIEAGQRAAGEVLAAIETWVAPPVSGRSSSLRPSIHTPCVRRSILGDADHLPRSRRCRACAAAIRHRPARRRGDSRGHRDGVVRVHGGLPAPGWGPALRPARAAHGRSHRRDADRDRRMPLPAAARHRGVDPRAARARCRRGLALHSGRGLGRGRHPRGPPGRDDRHLRHVDLARALARAAGRRGTASDRGLRPRLGVRGSRARHWRSRGSAHAGEEGRPARQPIPRAHCFPAAHSCPDSRSAAR